MFPRIDWFGVGFGKQDEPRRAYVLGFFISLGMVLVGKQTLLYGIYIILLWYSTVDMVLCGAVWYCTIVCDPFMYGEITYCMRDMTLMVWYATGV